MTIEELDGYINKKMRREGSYIVFTYYEVRVKMNLSNEELVVATDLIKKKLENNNYTVLFPGDIYFKQGQKVTVKENQLLVAIRD